MAPILLQDGEHGIGLGFDDFKVRFREICEQHIREGRAKAFAFVFCDFSAGVTASVLHDGRAFGELNDLSGDKMTVFYLHLHAHDAVGKSFNAHFLHTLGVREQVPPPCVVCFRVQDGEVEDVAFHPIDERTGDPVLVLEQIKRHLKGYLKEMARQGDLSALPGPRHLLSVAKLLKFASSPS